MIAKYLFVCLFISSLIWDTQSKIIQVASVLPQGPGKLTSYIMHVKYNAITTACMIICCSLKTDVHLNLLIMGID